MLLTGCDRSIKLRPIAALTALDLRELTDDLPVSTIKPLLYSFLLGLKPETALALPVYRDSVISDVFPMMCMHLKAWAFDTPWHHGGEP